MAEAERSSRAAHWLQAWGTLLSAVVGAAAAYFALTTYKDSVSKQVDERKIQVFRLHERFTSEPLFSIRKRIYVDVSRAAGCTAHDLTAGPADNNDRFAFVEFFDVVEACLAGGLCDRALTERLFAPYANGHWPYLKGYVSAVRRGESGMKLEIPFGFGIEQLARNPQNLSC
jgi:hypothetical protein